MLNNLPRHVISKIGEYLSIVDRGNCEISNKVFSPIHESITYHEIHVSSTINYKLKILFKKHCNLKNLTLHFKNDQYSSPIAPNIIPQYCKLWVTIEKCIYINEILLRLQNVVIYSLNICMTPDSIIEADPFICNTYTTSILIWKNQLNLLYYPKFLETCTNIIINVPEEISFIETSFLTKATTVCITTSKINAITDFDNITHLIIPKLHKVSYLGEGKRLQQIWLWNIAVEKFMFIQYPLFKLVSLLPRQVVYYIHATNHPFIVPILKVLKNDFHINIVLFYDSRISYLVSKIINFVLPDIQVINLKESNLYNKSCKAYLPDSMLAKICTKEEIWVQMTEFDRLIWYTYFV